MSFFFSAYCYKVAKTNTAVLKALFDLIESQKEFKQIFSNLEESIIVLENDKIAKLNDQFLEKFQGTFMRDGMSNFTEKAEKKTCPCLFKTQ